jgi:hypothetical protein
MFDSQKEKYETMALQMVPKVPVFLIAVRFMHHPYEKKGIGDYCTSLDNGRSMYRRYTAIITHVLTSTLLYSPIAISEDSLIWYSSHHNHKIFCMHLIIRHIHICHPCPSIIHLCTSVRVWSRKKYFHNDNNIEACKGVKKNKVLGSLKSKSM